MAIAALLVKLLVMDEATSALDTKPAKVDNLLRISMTAPCFITHRLSTIRNADVIVMLDKVCR